MKKNLLIISCFALLAACGGNSGSEYDKYYSSEGKTDSVEAAAGSAAAKRTEEGALAATYERGKKLIASSDCLACHQEKQKVVGPAYEAVARKYEFNDKNIDYLSGKILQGGKGVWGEVPMTPHPDLPEEDAKEMARYILALKK